jgi:hypothetical protein
MHPTAFHLRLLPSCAGHRLARLIAICMATAVLLLSMPTAASADPIGAYLAAPVHDLPTVITNIRNWIMGILAAVATLYLVLAGVYWATAGGDPTQVDRAKSALKSALIGYGLAVLAPVLLAVIQGIVGG